MRVWELTAPVRQKDGSQATQTQYIRAEEQPHPDAVERPRPPAFGEEWFEGAWRLGTEHLRGLLRARIKQLKEHLLFAPLQTDEGPLQVDRVSRDWLSETIDYGEKLEAEGAEAFSTNWDMADNSAVPVTLVDLRRWALLIGERTQAVVSRHSQLREAIANGSRAQLNALQEDIELGW